MTGNSNKVRAVFLAALMIFSVFAGTVAFSGSVAAQTVDDGSVSPSTVTEETTNDHDVTVNASSVDLTSETNVTVSFASVDLTSASITGVSASSSTGTAGSASVGEVDTTSNNVTITVDATGSGTSATLNVSFTAEDVVAPAVPSGGTTADVTAFLDNDTNDNTAVDSESVIQTLTIENSGDAAEYGGGAVLYEDGSTAQIEVPFESDLDASDVTQNNITLLEDGDEVATGDYSVSEPSPGRVVITGSFVDDATASDDIEVDLNSDVFDNGGEQTVAFAANSFDRGTEFDSSSVPEFDVYQGTTIAVYNASSVTDFSVEGDDSDYFQSFGSGTNSEVFFVETDDLELDTYEFNGEANFTVRNLDLQLEMDELNVTTEDSIEGTVSARASDRPVTIELVDDSGDTVDQGELNLQLGGQSEVDFEYDVDAIDLDTGEYTVQVTDDDSGIIVESSTITVSEEADDDASFTNSTISDQRGDIVEMTVQIESTDFASISVGEDDGSEGVRANATVEDEDGDGEVTVYLNTYKLGNGTANDEAFAVDDDSDDSVTDQTVEENTSDLIDAGQYDLEVMAGEETYDQDSDGVATMVLEGRSTETLRMWTGSSEEVSASDLEDVNEAIENGEITQSSEVAVGDLAVHQLVASGFEGVLEARENEEVSSQFETAITDGPLNLTIEEADPGANQDASELELNFTGANDNVTVIADGPNDTYFVIVDTGETSFKSSSPRGSESLPNDDDTALETNFTVLQDDDGFDFTPDEEFDDDENSETFVEFDANEPEVNVDRPFNVSQASGQSVSGTTNIAPGTELSLRVRSQSGVSPSFLKTADPVVQSDGTFSATFDFSEQSVGDEYDIQVNSAILTDGPTEESGTVVESVATATPEPDTPEPDTDTPEPEPDTDTPEPEPDTDTPEPDTATPEPETEEPTSTPTSTPGFGVVVALTALLAAALLAIRRD